MLNGSQVSKKPERVGKKENGFKNNPTAMTVHETCVRALIGRHMASFATCTKPIATSSTAIGRALAHCDLLNSFT